MRHLVDPAALDAGAFSWLFLIGAGLLLPLAAIAQQRQLATAGPLGLRRMQIYASAFVTHAALLLGAWLALHELDVRLFAPWFPSALHVLAGLALLALGLAPLFAGWTGSDSSARARTELIAPRSSGERLVFAGVAVSAGVAEEVAYRGLLMLLVAHLTGGWWLPAIVASLAFGAAHAFQGWRGIAGASAMGFAAQVVVGITGTLFVAIGVHIIHDLVAGAVISRRVSMRAAGGPPVAIP